MNIFISAKSAFCLRRQSPGRMENKRVWLNWEVFETAVIPPLFPDDISLEKIGQVASAFPDSTAPLSFDDWNRRGAVLFKLKAIQIEAIYTTLTVFVARDPLAFISQSRAYLATPRCLSCAQMRVADVLVFLYAIFVKKKFRTVSERANLEAFPPKPQTPETPAMSPKRGPKKRQSLGPKNVSHSQPQISRPLIDRKSADSGYLCLERFFLSRLAAFLRIYAPRGLTRAHVESLGLVLNGGPNLGLRVDSLADALNLFRNDEVEAIDDFYRTVNLLLTVFKEDEASVRSLAQVRSPLAYRPVCGQSGMYFALGGQERMTNEPLLIDNESSFEGFIVDCPTRFCDIYIDGCRQKTVYFCAAAPVVFVSHCKDSLIFVGAAHAVHLEYCANVRIIAATRMFHIDSSMRCTAFLISNTKPIVTGNCSNLVFAPYPGLYRKLGLDMLVAGVNPKLNLWGKPTVLAALAAYMPDMMPPAQFSLFCVPFAWAETEPQFNAIVPPEFLAALERKQGHVIDFKRYLDTIQEKDPDLFERLTEAIKDKAAQVIQENGQIREFLWLERLERQLKD
jgi:hypothetical protein